MGKTNQGLFFSNASVFGIVKDRIYLAFMIQQSINGSIEKIGV